MTDVLHNDAPIDADNHQTWVDVCAADAVSADRGVAALVAAGPSQSSAWPRCPLEKTSGLRSITSIRGRARQ